MLNPFPELLYLSSFFAPLLLRVAVAITFFYVAYLLFHKQGIGKISAFAHVLLGGLLLIGFYTQIIALVGAIGSIANIIMKSVQPELIPLSRVTLALLAVILLSLVLTGAGAFAFDLPL